MERARKRKGTKGEGKEGREKGEGDGNGTGGLRHWLYQTCCMVCRLLDLPTPEGWKAEST